MNQPTVIDGKSVYQVLEERGLLSGLTDTALQQVYNDHKTFMEIDAMTFNEAEAQCFQWMSKNDTPALHELRTSDPEKFKRMQSSYLKWAAVGNCK